MAFNQNAYNTRQYEVAAVGTTATPLVPGSAVKLSSLPTSLSGSGIYFQVTAASSSDSTFGVVSSQSSSISSTVFGRIVLLNSGLIPVLMDVVANKGDLIRVTTSDGKWGIAGPGYTSEAELVEDVSAPGLAWAEPKRIKV